MTIPAEVVPEKPYDIILKISEYIEKNSFIAMGTGKLEIFELNLIFQEVYVGLG